MSRPLHLLVAADGANYHVLKWLPALAEAGLRVTLATFRPPPAPLDGVEIVRLPTRGRTLAWRDFWQSASRLRRLIAERQPDALMGSYATHYGFLAARTGFRPFILQTWTLDATVYPFRGWRRHVLGPVVRYAMRRADVVTTDGEGLAREVRRLHPAVAPRVRGVTWGIRLADFDPAPELRSRARREWGLPEGAPVVVSARGVGPWYRPDVALPALRRVLDARPEAHALVLTLAQERTEAAQADLDALAAHPRARVFDRFLSRDEIGAVWSAADLLVSTPEADGVSEALLEGMLAGGIPVVSDIPSNRSFLPEGEAALYVPRLDADALADTLAAAVDALPGLRERIGARNRAWVRAHASVEGTAAEIVRMVYDLSRRGHHESGR